MLFPSWILYLDYRIRAIIPRLIIGDIAVSFILDLSIKPVWESKPPQYIGRLQN